MKNIGVIISTPPYGHASGREALDITLALSDINHLSLFFMHEGVFHLLPNQQPQAILARDYIPTFSMLDLYDITDVYFSEDDLKTRGLLQQPLVIDGHICNKQSIRHLLDQQDALLWF